MSVCPHTYDTVLVGVSVDNLFLNSSSLVSGTGIAAVLSIDGVAVEDSFPFVCIELLHCGFLFLLDACLVLCFNLSYLSIMAFLELQVLLHDAVHVAVIHIDHHNFFAFLQGFVLVFQA